MDQMHRQATDETFTPQQKENERSQHLLFQHFCNNLYLGQWQLAKASLQLLLGKDGKAPTLDILKDITTQPFNRNVLSPSLFSPCHLSWLCLLECERLACGEISSQVDIPSLDKELIEFNLLLLEVSPHLTDTVLKELYLYHRWVHSSSTTGHPLNLSSTLLKSLQTILCVNPQLGHSVIASVYDPGSPNLTKNNKALQLVYVNSISHLLENLAEDNLDHENKPESAAQICEILAYFSPGEELGSLQIRQLFSKILECCRLESNYLNKTKVLSVLICHSNNKLLRDYCSLDYELETNNAVASYQACAELTEEQRWILHLATLKDTNTRWKMFFLYAVKKKRHLLEVVMETGLSLIKCSMFKELERLLVPAELHPLKPLLLLLGWTYCYSSAEARELLDILWTDKGVCHHPAINMGCNKLAYQIDLIQWCLDKARPLATEESTKPQFQRAVDLFKGFENHSVLYVLHNATQLSALDQQEVLDLLRKVPLQGSTNDSAEKKKTKIVRFKEELPDSKQTSTATSIEQWKDIAIYSAYCSLKNVMDAIVYCSGSPDNRLTNPVRSGSRWKISSRLGASGSQEGLPKSSVDQQSLTPDLPIGGLKNTRKDDLNESSGASLKDLYRENVTNRLAQARVYLSKLQPLTFRVEILENIFSLLFVSHEDIQETLLLSEYNSDDGDDKSRGASTEVDTPLSSPMKEKFPPIFVPKVSVGQVGETDGAYDVPFDETDKLVTVSDLEKDKQEERLEEEMEEIVTDKMSKTSGKVYKSQLSGRRSSLSENISSISTSSSINLTKFGFLAGEYLVRDILAMLKDCILDASAARFQIHGNKAESRERYRMSRDSAEKGSCDIDPAIEEMLCRLVKSSVTMETLQKRITQLDKHTSEAHWRYQLVSHDKIPKVAGEILTEPVQASGDSSDEEVDVKGLTASQRSRKKRLSGRKSPRPGIETPDSVYSDGGVTSEGPKRRISKALTVAQGRSNQLISLMLASPVSLLTMSIRKGQFTQTKQIIKLFKLEKRPEANEVYFAQAFQKASRGVQGIQGSTSGTATSVHNRPSIKSLASVAAAGVATASVSDIVDELLAFPTMPQLPKLKRGENIPLNIDLIFQSENVHVMILLDLLCSSAKVWDVCNHLLDAIKSRTIKGGNELDETVSETQESVLSASRQRVNKIRTFNNMLANLRAILQMGLVEEFQATQEIQNAKVLQKSIQHHLCQAEYSLQPDKCKEYVKLCQNLKQCIHHFEECRVKKGRSRERTLTSEHASTQYHHQTFEGEEGIRPRSATNQNQPLVHVSIKQLIQVLEKKTPAGGLIALHGRYPKDPKYRNRNYLLSLYEHCKELACLVAESEAVGKEMVLPENYFTILDEGPLRILGHMMFHKKMPPVKLEKVAKKLSVNLTHIIVYSCCMMVPSKRLPLLPVTDRHQEFEVCPGRIVYNTSKISPDTVNLKPEEFVRNLLTKLIDLMKDIAMRYNAEGLFDTACADQLSRTTEFYDIISQTAVLQAADLLHLDNTRRRCFYGNLQTLMTIHCFVSNIHAVKIQEQSDDNDSLMKRDPIKSYSDMCAHEQVTLLSMFCYRVGQLGVISLFDLKYHINRSGLLPSSELGRILEHRLSPLNELDPWAQLAPSPNPQLLFAMATCCVSSPPLKVLVPETISADLDNCMKCYLQNTVEVDRANKLVKIPEMLLWHRRDFICEQNFNEYVSENLGLIAFIASQLTEEKEQGINSLIAEHATKKDTKTDKSNEVTLHLEVIPNCSDFMCVFDIEGVTTALKHSVPSSQSGKDKTGSHGSVTSDTNNPYSLTPNTLEYIKSDFPLVATLVSLMCSDEMEEATLEDAFDESHFNTSYDSGLSTRSRTSSSMSLVDMRSYRYEKLTYEYPTLKRRLLNFFVPLAAAEDHDVFKGDDPILKFLTSDSMERFKSSMLSTHESFNFRAMLNDLLRELFNLRKWSEVLQVIDFIPVNIVQRSSNIQCLHDFVVSCIVHTHLSAADGGSILSKEKSKTVSTLIHRMICPIAQAREILTVHQKLPIDFNMELFEMCLSAKRLEAEILNAVEQKFKQIKVYHRITECAKNLQIKLSMQTSDAITEEDKMAARKKHLILDKFTDWRTVIEWTRTSPREVLALLIKTGDFDTATSWSRLENLDDDIKMEIEENHVISLLNADPPKTTEAFMILEKLKVERFDECLSMCRKFVEVFSNQQDVMFVASYMISHMSQQLCTEDQDLLRLTHIGARMIMCLPESMHIEYCHLVNKPRYILEQLIMNMKPELASKAYQKVKDELELIHNIAHRFSVEQFNTLVALYAKKALEFTVIQYLDLEKERSFSMKSTSSDKFDPDQSRNSPLSRQSPRPDSSLSKRKSIDLQGTRMAVSAPGGVNRRGMSPNPRVGLPGVKDKFVMPAEPPSRDQWVPDSSASVCMVCQVERFSMFNRRHHCRRCGRVVCAGCSEKVTPIKGINARTCDDCYREIVNSEDANTTSEDVFRPSHRHSGTSLTPSSSYGNYQDGVMSPGSMVTTIKEERSMSLTLVVSHTHTTWKLQTDDMYNANLREDFYFEQAPSTSLCISVLNLHGNPRECGQLILTLCDDLSKFLKPLAPGIPNPEVDYNLIMSMMKYLLFHAKMKFTKCGASNGVAKCDMYQGLVDLLGILVTDNYRDLPSIQELTKVDSVRRLRDKLIEDERLSLAMEVSTKCGLDPTGVWVAWGMMLLHSGDFTTAREKFSKSLKQPKDKNMCVPVPKVLADIVECLESMPGTGSMEMLYLMANAGSVKNLISAPSSTFFEETSMDSKQFQECVFYLRTYGSYLSLVDFHRRHGYYMKAVQYILDHKCSLEVFIEGLLKPSLQTGEMGRLTDQMLMIDPSLERWNPYLKSTCQYLYKNRLHHMLYEFQLFMKDFIRAGMTCYTFFYQEGATSYLDLSRRVQHLFTAQQHMQAYLDPGQWGMVQHPLAAVQRQGSWEEAEAKTCQGAVRIVAASDEVKRQIQTIALQIEVTKFLHTCLTNGEGSAASVATKFVDTSKLPTLFHNSQARNNLAIMILLSGDDMETAFGLATRIIKEYKLGSVGIYTHAAREMAKLHRYDKMRQIVSLVENSGMGNDEVVDEILGACLLVVADSKSEAKEAENIIKLLKKDSNKINAYILCGKLRSAYLMAVKENRADDVKRILRAAKSMGQSSVINICNKWLEQNKQSS